MTGASVRDRLTALLGDVLALESMRGEHDQTRALRVTTRDGTFVARVSSSPRAARQERAALERLAAPDARGLALRVPRFVASDGDLTIVSWIEGTPVAAADVDVWAAVGAGVEALHGLRCDDRDVVSLARAVQLRIDRQCGDLAGRDHELSAWLQAQWRGGADAMSSAARVWCHRDIRPGNVVRDASGQLGLIDFEHACPDASAFDVARCAVALGPGRSADAFIEAARGDMPDSWLRLALAMTAAQTRSWAQRHGDEGFGRRARAWLSVLGAPG